MPRYEINAPHIVGEVVDGEAIIMDLKAGYYYSCTGVGAAMWRGVEARLSTETLVGLLCSRFPDERSSIGEDVATLIAQFVEHQLVRPAMSPAEPEPDDLLTEIDAYDRPVLQVYTDMQALLLLDPVHEVDEAGWPEAKR